MLRYDCRAYCRRLESSLLTKKQAAELLNTSVSYVSTLLARRKLPRVRLSYKVTRIPREAVEKFITSRTEVSR